MDLNHDNSEQERDSIYTESHRTWNSLAEWYEKEFLHASIYDEAYTHWLSNFPKGSCHAVDLGCGPGIIPHYVQKHRQDVQWTLVDVAPDMLKRAELHVLNGRFVCADVINFSAQPQCFEAVSAGFVLPYLPPHQVPVLLSNIHTWLKPSGSLLLSFVEGHRENDMVVKNSLGFRSVFHHHLKSDLLHLLQDIGYLNIKTFQVSYQNNNREEFHTIVVAQKQRAT
jgi:predicted TPR repeat methyltransferase